MSCDNGLYVLGKATFSHLFSGGEISYECC